MSEDKKIQVFEDKEIRKEWNEEEQDWYVSVVDVIGVLTDQPTQRGASTYWAVMKKRLIEEGADQLLTNCKQLKLKASDGKKYSTDVANTKELLRLIQSIEGQLRECKEFAAKQNVDILGTYIGEYSYRDVVNPGGIPAIVPQDLFDRVQERRAKNKKAPARRKADAKGHSVFVFCYLKEYNIIRTYY